jgi:hypothetical protein
MEWGGGQYGARKVAKGFAGSFKAGMQGCMPAFLFPFRPIPPGERADQAFAMSKL